jgi:hypothetical protein
MNIELALADTRTSQAMIGLPKKAFDMLVPVFEEQLKKVIKENPYRGGRPYKLKTADEKLFFVLYYLKNYPTYDVLGVEFGMHRSSAFRNVDKYMMALKLALDEMGVMPSTAIEDLNDKLKDVQSIIVDGTEQRKNRPKDKEKQKKYYSGKKNAIQ